MNQNDFHTGIDFARAVVKHFKLPSSTDAEIQLLTGADDPLCINVKIMLTADDLAGIASAMTEKEHVGRDSKLAALLGVTEFAPGTVASSSKVSWTFAPGDALVLTVPDRLSSEQAAKIKQRICTELDSDVLILIIDGGASLAVLSQSMA